MMNHKNEDLGSIINKSGKTSPKPKGSAQDYSNRRKSNKMLNIQPLPINRGPPVNVEEEPTGTQGSFYKTNFNNESQGTATMGQTTGGRQSADGPLLKVASIPQIHIKMVLTPSRKNFNVEVQNTVETQGDYDRTNTQPLGMGVNNE